MDQAGVPQETNPNINIHGLQNLVNQIVASNLIGAIFSRMEMYMAKEADKDYSLEANYSALISQATKDVINMYTVIWESLEAAVNNRDQPPEDTETDTSMSG